MTIKPLIRPFFALAAAASILWSFYYLPPDSLPASSVLFAFGIFAAGMLPFAYRFLMGNESSGAPIVELSAVFYAVCFAGPVLLLTFAWPPGMPDCHIGNICYYAMKFSNYEAIANPQVLALIFAGVSIFLVTFFLTRKWAATTLPCYSLGRAYPLKNTKILLYILLISGLAFDLYPQLKKLPSISQLAAPVVYIAIGGFMMLWKQKALTGLESALVFFGAIPAIIILKAVSGLLSQMIFIFIFIYVFCAVLRIKHAFLSLTIAGVVLISLYWPFRIYRSVVWNNPSISSEAGFSLKHKIRIMGKAIIAVYRGETEFSVQGIVKKIDRTNRARLYIRRFMLLPMFAKVYVQTPDPIAYLGGKTYLPLLTSFVPRVLWPAKPREAFGNTFGNIYGFVSDDDKETSINVPWIIELFINFGWKGVLAGMGAIGFLLSCLDRFFNSRESPPLASIVGISIIGKLAVPESNFSLMWGSIIPLAIFFYIFFRAGLAVPLERE